MRCARGIRSSRCTPWATRSESGYWRFYRGGEQYRVYAFVKIVMPLLTRIFGYFPGRHVAFGTDLAPHVLYEWSTWCTSPGYFGDDPSMRPVLEHARTLAAPTLMIGLADDPWATPRAIDALQVWYAHAPVTRLEIDPRAEGMPPVGHIDFFRSRNRALWERATGFLGLHAREGAEV
jgi:predicted alpha/beta hydrolase